MQSFIGLYNEVKENVGNSNLALLNQKKHFSITQKSVPTTNNNKWKNNNIRDQILLVLCLQKK